MDWRGRRTSDNIEDRRGRGGGAVRMGGIGGAGVIVVLLIGMFFGVDVTPLLQGGGSVSDRPSGPNTIDDQTEEFVGVVLAETEDVWGALFRQSNLTYQNPRLVLFSGVTSSGCGTAQSAMGPFYCPNDQTIYLDTDFFQLMTQKFGQSGDFARAYVIAHEVGHHVQDELGTLGHDHTVATFDLPSQFEGGLHIQTDQGGGRLRVVASAQVRHHLVETSE